MCGLKKGLGFGKDPLPDYQLLNLCNTLIKKKLINLLLHGRFPYLAF